MDFGAFIGNLTGFDLVFFLIPAMPVNPNELPFLRQIWEAIDPTQIAALFRDTLIPAFFALTGFLVPDEIEAPYTFG